MSAQLLAALEPMDRLNSWVRSTSFRDAFVGSSLRKHIYELKRRALVDADQRLDCWHRRITILATCRDCRGTGKYTDWDGKDWPHCRACGSTGVVRLHFVETRIANQFTWHSPELSFPLSGKDLGPETPALDWNVNLPGRDMTTEEVAGALLVCDEWRPERHQMDCRCGHSGDFCYRHYGLYIGSLRDLCWRCRNGATEALCCRSGLAEFTVGICKECRAALTTEAQFQAPVPAELLTPNIEEWMRQMDRIPRRRERMKSTTKKPNVEKLLYRRHEAAFALGLSVRSIDAMIADQRLTSRRFGRCVVIPAADLRRVADTIISSDMLQGSAQKRR